MICRKFSHTVLFVIAMLIAGPECLVLSIRDVIVANFGGFLSSSSWWSVFPTNATSFLFPFFTSLHAFEARDSLTRAAFFMPWKPSISVELASGGEKLFATGESCLTGISTGLAKKREGESLGLKVSSVRREH
jgi:hypothetical protein